jgi:hypothetical protein
MQAILSASRGHDRPLSVVKQAGYRFIARGYAAIEGEVVVRKVVSCAMACALGLVGAASASAVSSPSPNPEVLWRAFPLDETPTGGAGTPVRPLASQRVRGASSSSTDAMRSAAPAVALFAAASTGALLVFTALALRPGLAPSLRGPRTRASVAAAPALPVRASQPARSRVRDRTQRAPSCQIRWDRRASCFYAVMVDADGVEHKLARSPRFELRGPSPPGPSPLAQAALTQLVRELRSSGWSPLRAKGTDFDEPRWYARRFRRATKVTEDDAR